MTHAQIGTPPHKACCHIEDRPGCLHCVNYLPTLAKEGAKAIRTGEGQR